MTLQQYFEIGLTIDAYTQLLNEDQLALHQLHERKAEIAGSDIEALRTAGPLNILVITEPWCGDSLAIFPVVAKLFSAAGSEVRVIRRDEQLDLIDRFLTNGGRAVPIVVVLDEQFNVMFHWGPRPAPAQKMVLDAKAAIASGETDKIDVHKTVRAFYSKNQGKAIVSEFVARVTG